MHIWGPGVYFRLGTLLGRWGDPSLDVPLRWGRQLRQHYIPNIKENAWQRGNLNTYLSDDDLLKEYHYNGVFGVSDGGPLTMSLSRFLSTCA